MRGPLSLFSLLTASSIFTAIFAHPQISIRQDAPATPLPVTGVPGNVQPRLELRSMASDEPTMFFLFITAMQKFKENKDAISGYYAIAGIHGVPAIDWNGVEQCDGCDGATGYCTHNSVLFPAWHRAYVALLEQELYKIVQQVAARYPNSPDVADAASRMRFPYWDWAAIPAPNTPVLPTLITDQQITISGPDGAQTVDNPLFRYEFVDPSTLEFDPFKGWNHTLRHPSSNAIDALSDELDVISTLDQQRPSLQDQVYQLLSTCSDYAEFSNDDGKASSPGCANSLESIHNLIHSYMGGPQSSISAGHMTYLPVAAFDPAFWLHHTNVDRLFAMWQTLHSDSYGASQVATHNTWTIAVNTTQDANSPLKPFYKNTNGEFWTTNDVRDFESTFHYTYPGFTSTDRQGNMAKLVNALYGPDAVYVKAANPSAAPTSTLSISSFSVVTLSKASTSTSITVTSLVPTSVKAALTQSTFAVTTLSTLSPATISSTILDPTVTSVPLGLPTQTTAVTSTRKHGDLLSGVNGLLNDVGDVVDSIVDGISDLLSPDSGSKPATNPFAKLINLAGQLIPEQIVPKPQAQFIDTNGSLIQYVANVRFPRFALNGTYNVYLFNGVPADDNTTSFMTAPNLIGIVSALAGGNMLMGQTVSSSSVPLTRTLQSLVRNGTLRDMKTTTVLPYLEKDLTWRVVGSKGQLVDSAKLPGFQVSCYSSTSQQNSTTELPQWSKFVPQTVVTEQKAGGATNQTIIKDAKDASKEGYQVQKQNLETSSTSCNLPVVTEYVTVMTSSSCSLPVVTEYTTVTLSSGFAAHPTGSY